MTSDSDRFIRALAKLCGHNYKGVCIHSKRACDPYFCPKVKI